jgi:exosortase E/protease (VPEID-CTERM system)
LLLAAEAIGLSLRFDTASVDHVTSWWALPLRYSPQVLRLLLAVGISTLACAWVRSLRAETAGSLPAPLVATFALFLAAHLAAVAAFTGLTVVLLEGANRASLIASGLPLVWMLLALSAGALAVAAVVSPRAWPALVRQNWRTGLAGIAVGTAGWAAGDLAAGGWRRFATPTLSTACYLLRLVCPDAVCRPAEFILGTPTFSVVISPACSGYEGMGLTAAFLTGFLVLFRRELRFPHALLLLPVGVAAAWFLNAVRIAALIVVGDRLSPELALGGFHSQAGWLAFNAVCLGLVAVGARTSVFRAAAAGPEGATTGGNPTAAYLVPLLAVLATQMVTGLTAVGLDRLYPLRVVAAVAALWWYRRELAVWRWRVSWQAFLLGLAAFGLWILLDPHLWGAPQASDLPGRLAALPTWEAAAWIVFRVVGSVVTVPVVEELAFRAYLTRRLLARDFQSVPPGRFARTAFFLSSAIFGAAHYPRWLAGTLTGLVFALAWYRRGELADAVLAHAVTNALVAFAVLAGGAWYLW